MGVAGSAESTKRKAQSGKHKVDDALRRQNLPSVSRIGGASDASELLARATTPDS